MNNEHTVEQFLDYLSRLRHLSPATILSYRAGCRAWVAFARTRGLADLHTAQAGLFLDWIDERSTVENLADRTVEGQLSAVRAYYEYVRAFHHIISPVLQLPPYCSAPSAEKDFLSVREVQTMLRACRGRDITQRRNHLILALLWSLGLRSRELCAVNWGDIDLSNGTLLVRKGKGNKQRQLFLNERLLAELKRYRRYVRDNPRAPLLCRYCHEQGVVTLTGATVVNFFTWLSEQRHNCAGAINRKRASICMYLRHLRCIQIAGAELLPFEFIPRARQPYRGPIKTLEPDEVQRLLRGIERSSVLGYRDFTLYSLLYCLGLRLGEALAIDIANIDCKAQTIRIHGKGRKERTLPVPLPVARMLRQWLKHRKHLRGSSDSPALFLSKKGNRLSLRTAEDNFQKLVKADGKFVIPRVVPHTLRHSFASHALEHEKNLVVIKAILGHALLRSTEVYLHPSMRLMRRSADRHMAAKLIRTTRAQRKWIRGIQKKRRLA